MTRYHKKVYFPKLHISKLKNLTTDFNNLEWKYTSHCLKNLKYRTSNIKDILLYIKDYKLNADDIFEFYIENKQIFKICYRIPYNNKQDLILVIAKNKKLITIYFNSKDDEHYTLKKELYTQS